MHFDPRRLGENDEKTFCQSVSTTIISPPFSC
jgi:hypothetical protein